MAATSRSRADADKRAAAREAKLSELQQRLADEIGKLTDGQQWRAWLQFAARFPSYSFNNTVLIQAQRPDATWVAGYTAWKQQGRQVRAGEKGLAILAPVVGRAPEPTEPDPGDPAASPRADSEPAPPAGGPDQPRGVRGFRVVHVFDISQTDGPPIDAPTRPLLREPDLQLLAGQAPDGLWDALHSLATDHGYRVERGPCGAANGWTNYQQRLIRVRADVDDAQAAKTMIHENAHMLMHDPGAFPSGVTSNCQGTREVEAESVAFLVAGHHGMDTSPYSFGYITGWAQRAAAEAQQSPEDLLRAVGQRVMATALAITEVTDPAQHPAAAPSEELSARVQAGLHRTQAAHRTATTASAGAARPATASSAAEPRPVAAAGAAQPGSRVVATAFPGPPQHTAPAAAAAAATTPPAAGHGLRTATGGRAR